MWDQCLILSKPRCCSPESCGQENHLVYWITSPRRPPLFIFCIIAFNSTPGKFWWVLFLGEPLTIIWVSFLWKGECRHYRHVWLATSDQLPQLIYVLRVRFKVLENGSVGTVRLRWRRSYTGVCQHRGTTGVAEYKITREDTHSPSENWQTRSFLFEVANWIVIVRTRKLKEGAVMLSCNAAGVLTWPITARLVFMSNTPGIHLCRLSHSVSCRFHCVVVL